MPYFISSKIAGDSCFGLDAGVPFAATLTDGRENYIVHTLRFYDAGHAPPRIFQEERGGEPEREVMFDRFAGDPADLSGHEITAITLRPDALNEVRLPAPGPLRQSYRLDDPHDRGRNRPGSHRPGGGVGRGRCDAPAPPKAVVGPALRLTVSPSGTRTAPGLCFIHARVDAGGTPAPQDIHHNSPQANPLVIHSLAPRAPHFRSPSHGRRIPGRWHQ